MKSSIVRDRFLIKGHEAGSHDNLFSLLPFGGYAMVEEGPIHRKEAKAEVPLVIPHPQAMGAYYGATTLVQLIDFAKANSAVVGNIEVQDYPDIPYRMCADWVLRWDWDVNGYDWGTDWMPLLPVASAK